MEAHSSVRERTLLSFMCAHIYIYIYICIYIYIYIYIYIIGARFRRLQRPHRPSAQNEHQEAGAACSSPLFCSFLSGCSSHPPFTQPLSWPSFSPLSLLSLTPLFYLPPFPPLDSPPPLSSCETHIRAHVCPRPGRRPPPPSLSFGWLVPSSLSVASLVALLLPSHGHTCARALVGAHSRVCTRAHEGAGT